MSEEIHPPERRKGYKEIAKTIDERMSYLEKCFQRWLRLGLIAMSITGTATFIALLGFGAVLATHQGQNNEIRKLAISANTQADEAVNAVLQKERICADSSDVTACRALFERLARSVTDEQRYRLGCAAIKMLEGEVAKSIREDNPRCKR